MSNGSLKSNGGSGFAMGIGDGQNWDQVTPANGDWGQESADQYTPADFINNAPTVNRSGNDGEAK